jgi:betaine-aldehyde dehydrogenase
VIIDGDCDLPAAAQRIAWGKLLNAGQTCIAPDYVLVAHAQVDPLVQAILGAMQSQYPRLAQNPDYTSIISPRHWQRLQDMLADAQAQGAQLHVHHPTGEVFDPAARKMAPVIITGVRPSMRIAQEEIFGPVVCVIPFDTEAEAIAIANNSLYGLSGSVWTQDISRVMRVVRAIDTGVISVNTGHSVHLEAPFGGVKRSGLGQELGLAAIEHYSHIKSVFIAS